ncbi:hypothetical protein MUS1_06850 [Marinomonas ushuaiensis DSM 15871]|uniref:histidine kinase n=1 Tax=Marinomonas ushuaiensis DSM 15871 TaxID=1122207 RepID=X7E307_9GAMM|nr:response regulator [Marinomonas ushuaiensis]ETX09546.1 hypothetical protein MUS1_06850 [Marinomonas ushuaiensis DSM 15871]
MSLRVKTILLIGMTEAIFLLLLLWQSLSYLERSGEDALYRRANETSHLFSLLAKNSVISSDIASLDEITTQIAGLEGIRYIRVIDSFGVLAQAGDTSSLENGFIEDTYINKVNDGIFDVQDSVSVAGTEFAKIQVGLSVDSLLVFVTNARYRLIIIALAELLIVALVSLILGRFLTKGLFGLQKVALAVTTGDMTSRATNLSNDEIGLTAKAFNVMLDKINTDQQQLNENAIHLTAAKKEAEKASQAKSRFLSQMSHEIRSPMNAVLGAVNLVAEQIKSPPEYVRLLNTAKSSGTALLDVINEILDFSKIEAGHMELKYSEVDLASVVEDVLNSVEAKTRNPKLTLLGDASSGNVGRVITDAAHFRQILNILVDNACKFTEKGIVMVTIHRIKLINGNDAIKVNVKDSGIGIKEDSLDKIFDEFEQVGSTLEARSTGTGLGLNIAQGLIQLMNGTIGVNSVLGQGSEFYFTLPVQFAEEEELEIPMLKGPIVLVSDNDSLKSAFRNKMEEMCVWFFDFDNISVLREQVTEDMLSETAIWLIDDNVLINEKENNNNWINSLDINIHCISSVGRVLPAAYQDYPRINRPIFCHEICYLNKFKSIESQEKNNEKQYVDKTKNTVLLVDDIEANRFVAGETLKNRGYDVTFACDGIDALEQLTIKPFDVILMDVRMPRMNGIDAVKALKESDGINRHTPVIAMTANAEKSEVERCKAAGMEAFVGKPFDTQVLIDSINCCIYNKKSIAKTEVNNAVVKAEILSKEVLANLVEDTSPATVLTLIDFFLADIDKRVRLIKLSISNSDLEELGEHAHALKSSAGSLGASTLFTFCQNIERASLSNDLSKAKIICNELNDIVELTVITYTKFRSNSLDAKLSDIK